MERYTICVGDEGDGPVLDEFESSEGEWVRYEDAAKRIKELEIAIRDYVCNGKAAFPRLLGALRNERR